MAVLSCVKLPPLHAACLSEQCSVAQRSVVVPAQGLEPERSATMPYGGRRRRTEWEQWRQAGHGRPPRNARNIAALIITYTILGGSLL